MSEKLIDDLRAIAGATKSETLHLLLGAAADRIEELKAENERLWAFKLKTMSMEMEDIDVLTDPPPLEKEQRHD